MLPSHVGHLSALPAVHEPVRVVAIRIAVGAVVGLDTPVLELETDKAVIELPAFALGIARACLVDQILVTVGDLVDNGTAILRVTEIST